MNEKTMSKYAMLSIGYGVIDGLIKYPAVKEELEWKEYHGFPIAEIPYFLYFRLLSALNLESSNFTLQIGYCKPDYRSKDHYHKKGHQLVIPLGPDVGYPEPIGTIKIGDYYHPVEEGEPYYFPTGVPHNFSGDLYFINFQNPSLKDQEGNDDYYE